MHKNLSYPSDGRDGENAVRGHHGGQSVDIDVLGKKEASLEALAGSPVAFHLLDAALNHDFPLLDDFDIDFSSIHKILNIYHDLIAQTEKKRGI